MNAIQATSEVKRLAHQEVTDMIRHGELLHPSKVPCGELNCPHPRRGVVWHHDDYTKPRQVRPMCRPHHVTFHKEEERNARLAAA